MSFLLDSKAYLLSFTVVVTLVSSKDRRRRAAKGKAAKQKRTPVGVRFRCALWHGGI